MYSRKYKEKELKQCDRVRFRLLCIVKDAAFCQTECKMNEYVRGE